MKKIALLGEAMIELHGAAFENMQQTYGGDVINTSVYLARILRYSVLHNKLFKNHEHQTIVENSDVYFVSALGRDAISQQMLIRWQHEGLNTNLVLQDTNKLPGLYMIQLDTLGERSFLYWRNDSAARYLLQHPYFAKVEAHLKDMDVIYVSGISLAILPAEGKKQCLAMLHKLAGLGVKIIFDSNYRPALWDSLEQCRSCCRALYGLSFLVLATNTDEQAIWQDKDEMHMMTRIQAAGAKHVVIKAGEKGCFISDKKGKKASKPLQIKTARLNQITDSTAAGDAFNAGYLAAYLLGWDWQEAARFANELAREVIQHRGAIVPASVVHNFCCSTAAGIREGTPANKPGR